MPRIGETVTVYHDPLTRTEPELIGTVAEKIRLLPGRYAAGDQPGRLRLYKIQHAGRIYQRILWEPLAQS